MGYDMAEDPRAETEVLWTRSYILQCSFCFVTCTGLGKTDWRIMEWAGGSCIMPNGSAGLSIFSTTRGVDLDIKWTQGQMSPLLHLKHFSLHDSQTGN